MLVRFLQEGKRGKEEVVGGGGKILVLERKRTVKASEQRRGEEREGVTQRSGFHFLSEESLNRPARGKERK